MPKSVAARRTIFGAVAFLLIATVILLTWEETVEVDLNTGQVRIRTMCCFLGLSEQTDSDFAALVDSNAEKDSPTHWVRDSSRGLLHFEYVDYRYGGAQTDFNELMRRWQMEQAPVEQQKQLASYFLKLLREQRFTDVEKFMQCTGKEGLAMLEERKGEAAQ